MLFKFKQGILLQRENSSFLNKVRAQLNGKQKNGEAELPASREEFVPISIAAGLAPGVVNQEIY